MSEVKRRTFSHLSDAGLKCRYCWREIEECGELEFEKFNHPGDPQHLFNPYSKNTCSECNKMSWDERKQIEHANILGECSRCGQVGAPHYIEDKYFNYLCSKCIFYRDCLEEKGKNYGKKRKSKEVQGLQERDPFYDI